MAECVGETWPPRLRSPALQERDWQEDGLMTNWSWSWEWGWTVLASGALLLLFGLVLWGLAAVDAWAEEWLEREEMLGEDDYDDE